jgi:hypothetical protein
MVQMLHQRGHGPCAITWLVTAMLAAGCVPIGPNSVRSDQVDYADAISEASKRLTLTNIVKTRYGDATSYLVASQVVAGYQLQANVSVNADVDTNGGWSLSDSTGLTVGGQFNNNPTITYTPIAGANFAALLLQPIAPADIYALIASGTPADLVLGLLVGQVNGLRNDLIERPGATAADQRFREFLDLAHSLRAAGAFHFRVEGEGKTRTSYLVLPPPDVAADVARRTARFVQLLGLDPNRHEFPIVYGGGSGAPESIRLLTRSISEILRDLASLIDVPPEDVAAGRTYPSYTAEEVDLRRVRIQARVGDFRPLLEDVYVAASYRGRWFWIDDSDFRSKQVFSFIIDLIQLAQTTSAQSLPVITIPSG